MKKLTKKDILEQTDGGLKLFQILLPDLEMCDGKNRTNIDSPISRGRNCLSVYQRSPQLYFFKDHYTKHYGDIFEFVACLNKLDSKYDFKRILEIIGDILEGCYHQIPVNQVEAYANEADLTELEIVKEDYSGLFINAHFKQQIPYLESVPKYPIHLIKSFSVISSTGQRVRHEFDYSKPWDAYYALRIIRGQYYILFSPKSRKCYAWGTPNEFYVVGMESLFSIAYCENVLLRETMVLTNSVEGLLFLQDKGIPSIALLNDETKLPRYFEEVISPIFPNKFLLLDMSTKWNEQFKSFTENYGCTYIRSKESYLGYYFTKHKNAVDHIMSHFEFKDDFIYEGLATEIRMK